MKAALAIIGTIIVIGVIGGVIWWQLGQSPETPNQPQQNTGTEQPGSSNTGNPGGEAQVQSGEVAADIRNSAFSPPHITVRKGTTVTWTNQDAMGHNVVAAQSDETGGLPTEHALLGQGESFSHTFDTVGTFEYTCTPHPFMTGTVEVVE